MSSELEPVFDSLRAILQKHAGTFSVKDGSRRTYCLEGAPGPATLRAWRGKVRRPTIPVAWVQLAKAYVSFHLMAMDVSSALRDGMSEEQRCTALPGARAPDVSRPRRLQNGRIRC